MAAKPGSAPTTYSPNLAQKSRPPIFKDNDLDWVRPDGRGFHQCRSAFFRTGAVNSASGSAYAELGNTKFRAKRNYTTFATPVRGQGSDHKEFSSMLHKALEGSIILETFPKTTVDVFALVLESGGSDLPVVISCASLALADAGIMMYDLVAAVSVACLGKNLVIDPILEEESYQDGSLVLTCMPSRYEVTQLTFTGEWSTPDINEAMQLCLDGCSKLGKVMSTCLKKLHLLHKSRNKMYTFNILFSLNILSFSF
ncbi:hypothetical protein V6N11_002555 [Hibiscus sabdariffa]|uniref:Uncharacterized protein n=1 Tax=Hibiscus sabdariffa TaxID=183260 RepID=A0ABR2SAN2_9ROSI